MSEPKEISRKPLEDWGGKFLYREIEDLSATDFVDKPERALARAELHSRRLLPVIKSLFNSEETMETAQLSLHQLSQITKTELRCQILTLAKKPDLWLKFADWIITLVNFELTKTNRAWTVEKEQVARDLEEIFLPYVESYLLPVLEKFFEMINEATKEPLPMSFDATFGESQPIQYTAKLHAFNSRKYIQELAVYDPAVKRAFQAMLCPVNEAIVTDREGDPDKAFNILRDAFRFLKMLLRKHRWAVPGARFSELENWNEPHNEEVQLLQIGLFGGIQTLREKSLLELLPQGATGGLRNYLIEAAKNKLFEGIRTQNRRLGIKVPPDRSNEGKTEDEIRKQVDEYLHDLAGGEFLDYEMETKDGSISTLEQASDKQAFREWAELHTEEEAAALRVAKIQELSREVKLTPRLRLVAQLYDKPNGVIAARLERKFGKPFTVGAVRALKHDLFVKLREVTKKK